MDCDYETVSDNFAIVVDDIYIGHNSSQLVRTDDKCNRPDDLSSIDLLLRERDELDVVSVQRDICGCRLAADELMRRKCTKNGLPIQSTCSAYDKLVDAINLTVMLVLKQHHVTGVWLRFVASRLIPDSNQLFLVDSCNCIRTCTCDSAVHTLMLECPDR